MSDDGGKTNIISPATTAGGLDPGFAGPTDPGFGGPTAPGFNHPNEVPLEQISEEYPWAKFSPSCLCGCFNFVLQLVLLSSVGSFLFGFNISLLNTAMDNVFADFQQCGSYTDLDCDAVKWLGAFLGCAILIGGAVGSMTGGSFMAFGRRLLLTVTMVLYAIGIISSVCANSFSAMMWARLVVGYAVGLTAVTVPTYMSEVTPAEMRGKYGVFHQLFITVGILVGILIGLPLESPSDDYPKEGEPPFFQRFWWRLMLGLGILPVLLELYLLLGAYTFETPVWYVEQRRFRDAASALRLIHDKQDVTEELRNVIDNVRQGVEAKKNGMTFGAAFGNPEYRHVILVGIGLAMGQQFGGINVFMTSSSALFKQAGLSSTMQTVMSIIMAAINVVMTFPTIILIEKMGRRSLLLCGSALQFLFVVPAAVSYWTEDDAENPGGVTQALAIVAVLGFVCFFAVAFGPVVWVYLFEIYPMEIKDVAAGAATACNWIAGIIMVFVALVVPNQISFTIFAVMQLLATLFVFFFMKETKGLPLGVSPFITKTRNDV